MKYSTLRLPVLESRVDWITCTAPRGEQGERLLTYGSGQVDQEHKAGEKVSTWGFQGYRGFQAGNWRAGWGKEGACVVASGERAHLAAPTLAAFADHWSRLDYCVTVLDRNKEIQPDEDYWQEFEDAWGAAPNAVALTRIQGRRNGATVSVAERSSTYYGRVYDKHAESRLEYPAGAWRWEIELKRHASEAHQMRWRQQPFDERRILNIVADQFKRWKLTVPWGQTEAVEREKVIGHVRDADRTLLWLNSQVRPSVEFAIEARGKEAVLEALGLPHYKEL